MLIQNSSIVAWIASRRQLEKVILEQAPVRLDIVQLPIWMMKLHRSHQKVECSRVVVRQIPSWMIELGGLDMFGYRYTEQHRQMIYPIHLRNSKRQISVRDSLSRQLILLSGFKEGLTYFASRCVVIRSRRGDGSSNSRRLCCSLQISKDIPKSSWEDIV